MPGVASLEAQQYYAHPRNAFWPIVDAVLGIDRGLAYDERCRRLTSRGVAVWDVLRSCYRPGSLDADIRADSVIANDIPGLLETHPHIDRIGFNGGAAENLFRRHVLPVLTAADRVSLVRLPSTSPAHASMRLAEKVERWRSFLVD